MHPEIPEYVWAIEVWAGESVSALQPTRKVASVFMGKQLNLDQVASWPGLQQFRFKKKKKRQNFGATSFPERVLSSHTQLERMGVSIFPQGGMNRYRLTCPFLGCWNAIVMDDEKYRCQAKWNFSDISLVCFWDSQLIPSREAKSCLIPGRFPSP